MKVAHLIPTLHADGPEIGLVDLAGAARQADIEMIVIGLSVSSDIAEISALRRAGVPVAELDLFPWDPRAVARTAKLLREQRVELVHTHLPQADVVGAAAAARNRIPAVSTLHRIHCTGATPLKYVAIDCFPGGRPAHEPTWDSHVKVVCQQQGWDYNKVVAR